MTESLSQQNPQLAAAQSMRHCLAQLMQEALDHNLHVAALHIRIAVLELDDMLQTGQMQKSTSTKRRGRNAA